MKKNSHETIFWSVLVYREWRLPAAATSRGLCWVGAQAESLDGLSGWAGKRYPGCKLVQADEILQPFYQQLIEYFDGERLELSVPLDVHGTPFQLAVWNELCSIPYGETRSYSEIAHRIGRPASVRAVGAAIGANPVLLAVPCHRVIGKHGSLTGYRGGLDMKTKLLQLEKTCKLSVSPDTL